RRHGASEASRQQRLSCRIWCVGDYGQPSARDRARDDGVTEGVAQVWYKRSEIRNQRVVVEACEQRRTDEERHARETAQHRREPPPLEPAVDDESAQEEADEQRRSQLHATLIC